MPRTNLPAAVQRQLEDTERMDAEIALAAPASPEIVEPPPVVVVDPTPAPATTEDTWQHKYLTLQGKYNADTAALRTSVQTLSDDVQALKAAQTPTPPPEQPTVATPAKLVTETDVETFGADLVDLMRRVAVEADAGKQAALQAEIETLKSQIPTLRKDVDAVTSVTVADRREAFFVELEKLVPDYAAINVDDAFKGWLTLPDALSGSVRNDLIQTAFHAYDHARTALIFNTFKQDTGSAPAPDPAPSPASPPKPGLEAQVSPSGNRTPTEITPDNGQKTWSSAEMADFYNRVTRGDYRGNQAEAQRIDAEIDKALSEGRVTA